MSDRPRSGSTAPPASASSRTPSFSTAHSSPVQTPRDDTPDREQAASHSPKRSTSHSALRVPPRPKSGLAYQTGSPAHSQRSSFKRPESADGNERAGSPLRGSDSHTASSAPPPKSGLAHSQDSMTRSQQAMPFRRSSNSGRDKKGLTPHDAVPSAAASASTSRGCKVSPKSEEPNSKPIAVHFGPGNIGRGLIAPILKDAGFHIVFAHHDNPKPTCGPSYSVVEYTHTSPHPKEPIPIKGYRWYSYAKKQDSQEPYNADLQQAIARASIVTVATALKGYDLIAENIANALKDFDRETLLPVIGCENDEKACDKLLQKLVKVLPNFKDQILLTKCMVDRIVPNQETGSSPLRVEAYQDWTIVGDRFPEGPKDMLRTNTAVKFVMEKDFPAWLERKKFTVNTAHCTIAYSGAVVGRSFIHEAMKDTETTALVRRVLAETSKYLIMKYRSVGDEFRWASLNAYGKAVMDRFRNAFLNDSVTRVAKDPLKKLGNTERLMTPAMALKANGMEPTALLDAIALALRYHDVEGDENSTKLATQVRIQPAAALVETVCNVDEKHPLFKQLEKRAEEAFQHHRDRGGSKMALLIMRDMPSGRKSDEVAHKAVRPGTQAHAARKDMARRSSHGIKDRYQDSPRPERRAELKAMSREQSMAHLPGGAGPSRNSPTGTPRKSSSMAHLSGGVGPSLTGREDHKPPQKSSSAAQLSGGAGPSENNPTARGKSMSPQKSSHAMASEGQPRGSASTSGSSGHRAEDEILPVPQTDQRPLLHNRPDSSHGSAHGASNFSQQDIDSPKARTGCFGRCLPSKGKKQGPKRRAS